VPVHLDPELEKKLDALAAQTGRPTSELVEDAMAGYLTELNSTRETLHRRHDQLKSGQVEPIDGEEARARLQEKSARRRDRPA
jgi:predicted transcriptional regulator